jgi:hypothetical protein
MEDAFTSGEPPPAGAGTNTSENGEAAATVAAAEAATDTPSSPEAAAASKSIETTSPAATNTSEGSKAATPTKNGKAAAAVAAAFAEAAAEPPSTPKATTVSKSIETTSPTATNTSKGSGAATLTENGKTAKAAEAGTRRHQIRRPPRDNRRKLSDKRKRELGLLSGGSPGRKKHQRLGRLQATATAATGAATSASHSPKDLGKKHPLRGRLRGGSTGAATAASNPPNHPLPKWCNMCTVEDDDIRRALPGHTCHAWWSWEGQWSPLDKHTTIHHWVYENGDQASERGICTLSWKNRGNVVCWWRKYNADKGPIQTAGRHGAQWSKKPQYANGIDFDTEAFDIYE